MIREKIKGTNGKPIEIVRPETKGDTSKIESASKSGDVALGESFGDFEDATESELIGAGVIDADET